MSKNILSVLVAVATVIGLGLSVRADEAEVRAAAERTKDAKLRDHLMNNIDIFGKTDLPAIYIFAPGESGEEEIKGELLTRDFSRDPFFMQNVDREEFELKVVLRELNGDDEKKKKDEVASH